MVVGFGEGELTGGRLLGGSITRVPNLLVDFEVQGLGKQCAVSLVH